MALNSFEAMLMDSNSKRSLSDEESSSEIGPVAKRTAVEDFRILYFKSSAVNLPKVNPLLLDRAIQEAVGPVNNVWLLSNSVKIKCTTAQANLLQKQKRLAGYPVSCEMKEVRDSRTFTKGIIHGVHVDIPDSELLQAFKVPKVERLTRFNQQTKTRENTSSVIVSCSGEKLPERLCLGFQSFRVHTYIPPPVRCYKCQRYGHTALACRGARRCPRCGGDHDFSNCNQDLVCCLCGGNHSAAYKGCQKYKDAFAVQKVKFNYNISYAEAAKRVNAQSEARSQVQGSIPPVVEQTPPAGQLDLPSQSQQSIVTPSYEQIESLVHSAVDSTFANHVHSFTKIVAFVLKIVALAQDQTFWKVDRKTRVKHVTDIANVILDIKLEPEGVLETYQLAK